MCGYIDVGLAGYYSTLSAQTLQRDLTRATVGQCRLWGYGSASGIGILEFKEKRTWRRGADMISQLQDLDIHTAIGALDGWQQAHAVDVCHGCFLPLGLLPVNGIRRWGGQSRRDYYVQRFTVGSRVDVGGMEVVCERVEG